MAKINKFVKIKPQK